MRLNTVLSSLGNICLCQRVAMLFEDHKHGQMTPEKREELIDLLDEIERRASEVLKP